jgi:Flp pilus assembly protein TadD
MSLLMKALEKAAKDRGEARSEPVAATPAAAVAPARSELSLEPMGTGAPAMEPSTAPRAESTPRPAAGAPRAAAAPSASASSTSREQAQAQASTVMQAQSAGRAVGGGAGAYVRAHPVLVFGSLAGLAAIGFGIYVYLQIFHPAMFVARPAPAPKAPVAPLVQAPPPVAPALPSAPLLKEAASESAQATSAAPAAVTIEASRPKPLPTGTTVVQDDAPRNAITVSRGSPEPTLNPLHAQAYAALQAGQTDEARRLYGQLAGAEPKNVDALLGLAAIAAKQGNTEEASRRYLQILELEPRHALAQSGLIALLGRADPLAAESRLRQLIAREPSAYLYFTLGNLYADQSQWAPAQQAYFQAHHLEPANPDYAYNLAVALEHVSQPKLALGFYQRAVQLASARGRANFSLPQARERVAKLALQVE